MKLFFNMLCGSKHYGKTRRWREALSSQYVRYDRTPNNKVMYVRIRYLRQKQIGFLDVAVDDRHVVVLVCIFEYEVIISVNPPENILVR